MIAIAGLRFRSLAIDRLDVPPGTTAVIGRNGSGKTTLLRILAGIDQPSAGTVAVDGLPPRERDAGWVGEYPDRSLVFLRVYDEIASSLRFRGVPCSETDQRVKSLARRMGIEPLLFRTVRELSGGEKVLAAIAAALVLRPAVLVLDEYDSHLDAGRALQIDRLLRSSGAAYLIRCTQRMETAAAADTVIALEAGRLAGAGTPGEVFARYRGTPFYPRSWRAAP